MRKIISVISSVAMATSMFVMPLSAGAVVPPNWDITGTWTFNDIWLGTPYEHTMVISSFNPVTGDFSGTGYYNANPALTWTVTGTESGNGITLFHLLVTAVAPGVTIDGTGTISSGTFMSGTGYQSNLPGPVGTPNIEWTATGIATLLGTLSAEDFGVVNYDTGLGMLTGYTAGFGLTDATFAGATSVEVKLYAAGDVLLQTNTAILPKFNDDITGTQFSSPFDVSGTFDYATDGYWTNVRETEYGQSVPAVKVVATVTLANGKVVTATNTNLTGDPTDMDGDGVLNGIDLCLGTLSDTTWGVSWGTNRWQVQGTTWYQNKPKVGATTGENISYTYGCNGHQILQMLKNELGDVMNGHWKYGLSSSVLEDFRLDLNDGVLDGRYFIETVTVPASKSTDTLSANPLVLGINYILKARGTALACNEPGCVIQFDAEYSTSDGGLNWVDGVVPPYDTYGSNLLDLMVNGGFVDWGAYNSSNKYEAAVTGTGAVAPFRIYDVYYPNNTGNLYVDIYAQL